MKIIMRVFFAGLLLLGCALPSTIPISPVQAATVTVIPAPTQVPPQNPVTAVVYIDADDIIFAVVDGKTIRMPIGQAKFSAISGDGKTIVAVVAESGKQFLAVCKTSRRECGTIQSTDLYQVSALSITSDSSKAIIYRLVGAAAEVDVYDLSTGIFQQYPLQP
jgi:hypothetical protein